MSTTPRNRLFCPTVARQSEDGTWLLMNRQRDGFASFAFPYFTLGDIESDWQVQICGAGVDEFSTFRHVLPID